MGKLLVVLKNALFAYLQFFKETNTLGSHGNSERRHIWMSRGGFSLNATKNFGAYRLARATGSVEWADVCMQKSVFHFLLK